ncbi:hypothetical protein J4772_15600 [Cohnella sp. LGH]|uniref:hypothetical protein n=1 Tax=Cohnella sp. LGH TaxID=1619153 RepID=UPI001ADD5FC6|nr:hypothetical protein [Cohnella sp. LGH]QTH45715.1 hypothetical protein J4772_15600 [Cohnella sp. LGH]
MNLNPYIGQYIRVVTQDQEWFVGELLTAAPHGNDNNIEFEFNIISSSKDRNMRLGKLTEKNRDLKKNTGIHIVKSSEILEIEELDPKVQQGIKLTLNNVPDIADAYRTMSVDTLPNKIEFGKLEEPDKS